MDESQALEREVRRRSKRPVRTAKMTPGLARPIHDFFSNVNLPDFKRALEFSGEPRHQMLLAAISAKAFANCSFPELVRRCRLTIRDLTTLWKDYQLSLGTSRMSNFMPQLMEDIAKDSLTREYACPACDGSGKKGRKPCGECKGDGRIREIGDKDSRSLVFEAMGLKKSTTIANVMNVNAPMGVEDALSSFENMVDITPTAADAATIGAENGGDAATCEPPASAVAQTVVSDDVFVVLDQISASGRGGRVIPGEMSAAMTGENEEKDENHTAAAEDGWSGGGVEAVE